MSRVLVTGASGALGSVLVQQLLREGIGVVAVDRGENPRTIPGAFEVPALRRGDPLDAAFLASCMEGVDAVIHTAGHTGERTGRAEHRALTVDQTRMLLSASQRRGVQRFLLIGSGYVYRRTSAPLKETDDLDPAGEPAQNQIEAERIVLRGSPSGLPRATVLRPGAVYGPGCRDGVASLAVLAALVRSLGPLYLPFYGGPRIHLAHVDDLARAALFLLRHPAACDETFNVGDRRPLSFGDCINLSMESYGLKPLTPGTPYPPGTLLQSILPYLDRDEIFNPLSRVGALLWDRMTRKQRLARALSPAIDPEAIAPRGRDLLLDCAKLAGLGFKPKHPSFRKGWEKTMAWYEKRGWIPRPEAFA